MPASAIGPTRASCKRAPMSSALTISIPHLQTERLLLREYRPADFEVFAAHLANPVSAVFLTPADRPTAWRIFCSHAGLWLLHGAGWWAVEDRYTGELIGSVGAFFREHSTLMELGWNTYGGFGGRGYASEAAAAALDHAFDTRREPKVHALIDPANAASLGVARRLGLRYAADTELHGKAIGSYTRERKDKIA